MRISEMPFYNTPYHRLKKKGVGALSEAELLAIVIGSGSKGENAIDRANRLLKKYNLNKLGGCSLTELKQEVGEAKAMRILSLFELNKRHNKLIKGGFTEKTIENAQDVFNIFVDELKDKKKEHFYVLYLDTKNRIIERPLLISRGTLNASLVHPREIFKEAVCRSANALILVHNHPSGDFSPSPEDIRITEKLVEAGELLGISVLDHVIVGDKWWSWKEGE